MRKATHSGTCQCCGRIQAVTSRGTAKHGYTKDALHGFFQGTCAGSDEQPIEVSTDLLDQQVTICRNWLKLYDQAKLPTDLGPLLVRWVDYSRYIGKKHPEGTVSVTNKDELTEALSRLDAEGKSHSISRYSDPWDQVIKSNARRYFIQANDLRDLLEDLEFRKEDRAGKPLYERLLN